MTNIQRKVSLSPQGRRLLELMQKIRFGQIKGLVVRNGEPVLDPLPQVVRDIKFCSERGSKSVIETDDFALKAQVVECFAQLKRLDYGTVDTLEIQNGLPFRMSLEEKNLT